MNLETATAADIFRHLLDVEDRLAALLAEDQLTLERDSEQVHGTARNAVHVALGHIDAARQVLALLETRD